jgi:hypothetical protein
MFVCFIGNVFASVEVSNYSVDSVYYSGERLRGDVEMIIDGESYDELLISNNGDAIELGVFLEESGNLKDCFPADCSSSYSFSGESASKRFDITLIGKKYVGFVLTGENVVLDKLNFTIESDFLESSRIPLNIDFFENRNWKFDRFSNSFLDKNWGCYNPALGSVGVEVGKSFYCEKISVKESGVLNVGAAVNLSGSGKLNITVYMDGLFKSKCSYDPRLNSSCLASLGEGGIFSAGDYDVCVNVEERTGYRIYEESEGENCGFVYGSNVNLDKDYAIFAQGVKYANYSVLPSINFGDEKFVKDANDLLEERYNRDCSEGCVLPLVFSGVAQNIRIYDIDLEYSSPEVQSVNSIYDLNVSAAKVYSEGEYDLSALGFNVTRSMNYIVSLGSTPLFEKKLTVISLPVIVSVLPVNPPAGVDVKFYANIDFNKNASLVYNWDFGDGKSVSTKEPFIVHTYSDLENYILSLEVVANGNLTSSKSFDIQPISPIVAVNTDLNRRENALDGIVSSVENLSLWYEDKLLEFMKINFFKTELDKLDKERNESIDETDFVDIAKKLYALDIPQTVSFNSYESPYLMTKAGDINVDLVKKVGGEGRGSSNNYINSILNWQNANIGASFDKREIEVLLWSGKSSNGFVAYSFKVKSISDVDSYFFVDRPLSSLHFRRDVGARGEGSYTIIDIDAGSEKVFEFYYEDSDLISFFISPSLSSIIVQEDIDTSCNYNLVCEPERNETTGTCRNDCKPVGMAVVYLVLALIFILVVYSVLQIWYKRNYEAYLFRDRKQLYNLLMFVTNARARGMKDGDIASALRKQGWSGERISYIIKKSNGERTGLYEIIPFEKVAAYFRNRKARNEVARGQISRVVDQVPRDIIGHPFPGR